FPRARALRIGLGRLVQDLRRRDRPRALRQDAVAAEDRRRLARPGDLEKREIDGESVLAVAQEARLAQGRPRLQHRAAALGLERHASLEDVEEMKVDVVR